MTKLSAAGVELSVAFAKCSALAKHVALANSSALAVLTRTRAAMGLRC